MSTVPQRLRDSSRRLSSRIWSDRDVAGVAPREGESRPRVLILSASVGAGHVRAAEAVQSALSHLLPNATIAHVDVLQLTNAPFRGMYGKGYYRAIERAPHLVGLMYDLLDRPPSGSMAESMRLRVQRLNFSRLTRFLSSRPWDLVINTHFLAPELISWMRRSARVEFPQVTVVTDFDAHGMWIHDPCEHYFVASEEARTTLRAADVDPSNISVSGIPIDPVFLMEKDALVCRRKHHLALDRPVVLQAAGGFGIGSIQQIHDAIRNIDTPLQIVVVTGKNARAYEALSAMPRHPVHQIRLLGFTTEMDEYLAAADVIVSKPGGLTTSESLARGCPMAIVEPIPGQEDRNSDFLLENGCGIKINNLANLTQKLGALLSDPPRLRRMREAARRCGQPRAAFNVAERCVELLHSHAR
jgi:processive 1,2-diacylglycerol beta-glucosyltransferase